tara:strand:- start:22611 stop:23336 length:726 start_codon:yes stop_codon:yes gene_type:complete
MINEVRNTVLSILNKNNYGYISPSDFNLFAKQAQLDIFEQYFYGYNRQINKENNRLGRLSGSGLADLKKQLAEVIDTFTMQISIAQAGGVYPLPNDWYTLLDLLNGSTIVERVNESKINLLNSSLLTAPSTEFPAYVFQPTPSPASNLSNSLRVYPNTIVGNLTLQYIRYPKDPKWTFNTLTLGEPIFDQSQPDYQDFELPMSDYAELVTRILKYSGLSIREQEIVADANASEILNTQTET